MLVVCCAAVAAGLVLWYTERNLLPWYITTALWAVAVGGGFTGGITVFSLLLDVIFSGRAEPSGLEAVKSQTVHGEADFANPLQVDEALRGSSSGWVAPKFED